MPSEAQQSTEGRQSPERQPSTETKQSTEKKSRSKRSTGSRHSMTLRRRSRDSLAAEVASSKYEPNVEPRVLESESMPKGYHFVPKGDPFLTRHCRKETQLEHKTVYVVVDEKKKPMGIRVPESIYMKVKKMDRVTRKARKQQVRKSDESVEKSLKEAIISRFPRLPSAEINKIVCRATAKGKGRVGRTGTIGISEKARLAVQAYIRHTKTNYDDLLRDGTDRESARGLTSQKTIDLLKEWGPISNKERKAKAAKRSIPVKSDQRTKAEKKSKEEDLPQKATTEVNKQDMQTERTNRSAKATNESPQRVSLKKTLRDAKKASLRNITAARTTAEKHRNSKKQKPPKKLSKKAKRLERQKKDTQVAKVAKRLKKKS